MKEKYEFKCKICGKLFTGIHGLSCHVSKSLDHPNLEDYYEDYDIERDELIRYMQNYIRTRSEILKNGCWKWLRHINWNGYPYASGNMFYKRQCAHQISYRVFIGDIPKNREINHKCRNKNCVNPSHLETVTHKKNIEYYYKSNPIKKSKKSIPCLAAGKIFLSLYKAAKFLKVAQPTIKARIIKKYPGYKYLS